jgi:hypothetical protein
MGIQSECQRQVLKIEKQLLWNLLRIKRNLCEGYFIRVLETLDKQEIALGSGEIEKGKF